ncbi:MAG: aldehyde-activating protein [Boseongicola sp.]|nr:MAG: aldehyde-activating protein [Boseongicola sp.]
MHKGRCACGSVTYEMTSGPMFVHNCHCTDCQRQSGSAYVVNAMIERDRLNISGALTDHLVETPSGSGQKICRCADCGVAIYSAYLVRGEKLSFLRVGTLDDPNVCPPDVQIWTRSKQAWVTLSNDIPAFEEYYDMKAQWPVEAWERRKACLYGD